MAPLTTTRTLVELRVGSTHTIEVLLQIRLADINWWNSDLLNHERQLYKLIGRRVLPNECCEEIEADRARAREAADNAKGKKGVIGEANLTKRAAEKQKTAAGGRKRGGTTKETKSSKKKKGTDEKNSKDCNGQNAADSEFKEKKLKLLREKGTWIMGKSIQICKYHSSDGCYVMEEIDSSSAATLIFRPKENHDTHSEEPDDTATGKQSQSCTDSEKMVPLATFRTWKKIPKRLNLWVFKLDPNDPTDLSSSEGGGFPRPELLPVADIFRSVGGDD